MENMKTLEMEHMNTYKHKRLTAIKMENMKTLEMENMKTLEMEHIRMFVLHVSSDLKHKHKRQTAIFHARQISLRQQVHENVPRRVHGLALT